MMRAIVVALLVANLAFWVWSTGWLDGLSGGKAQGDHEPERLARQVKPEAISLKAGAPGSVSAPTAAAKPASTRGDAASTAVARASEAVASAAAPAAADTAFGPDCLEAGPFSPTEVVSAEAALVRAALPANSWVDVATDQPGLWIIYMGRFANNDMLARKEDEVKRLRITPERVDVADLQPGLVLGRYTSRSSADDAMGLMMMRGLQGARVVAAAPPQTTHVLRVEKPASALKAQLAALKAPALGSGFVRCGTSVAAAPGR